MNNRLHAHTPPATGRVSTTPLGRWGAVMLLALVGVSYQSMIDAGFVWDDIAIVRETVLHRWDGLVDIWLSPRSITREGHYWPIVYTSFWAEHKIWGLDPLGYHAVNVALHAANSWLAWRVLERLEVRGAWIAAAIFATHPVHVQSVAWIIERKDLLSTLFYLLAALTWLKFEDRPSRGAWTRVAALYVAALLSKSVAVTLPAALAILAWWKHGRIAREDIKRLAPLAGLGGAITLADFLYYRSIEPVNLGYSVLERVLNAGNAITFYATKLVWPQGLAPIYPLAPANPAEIGAWLGIAAVLAGGAALYAQRKRCGRGPFAGGAFFIVTLAPTLGFIDFGYMEYSLVADRFQYLASLGLIAVAAAVAATAGERLRNPTKHAAIAAGAAVLGTLAILSVHEGRMYRSQSEFFTEAIAHNPQALEARLNLALALYEEGRYEESAAESRTGAISDPRDARYHHVEAEAVRRLGRHEKARAAYEKAISLKPGYARAHAGLGHALLRLGRPSQALAAFASAESLDPEETDELHNARARALLMIGRLTEAIESYRKAVSSNPLDARAWANLGSILVATGTVDEGIQCLERAAQLEPELKFARERLKEAKQSAQATSGADER